MNIPEVVGLLVILCIVIPAIVAFGLLRAGRRIDPARRVRSAHSWVDAKVAENERIAAANLARKGQGGNVTLAAWVHRNTVPGHEDETVSAPWWAWFCLALTRALSWASKLVAGGACFGFVSSILSGSTSAGTVLALGDAGAFVAGYDYQAAGDAISAKTVDVAAFFGGAIAAALLLHIVANVALEWFATRFDQADELTPEAAA